ncbi:ABC transporter ATP-binding protein [Catenulispora subtropica]|uniref:ABC transporter ATP-binding protein n=1 Tax=Catenulispora subtropica TaxID=450798 RepID=A0ABP5EUX0_9ACTN
MAIQPKPGRFRGVRDAFATTWMVLREDPARGVGGTLMIFSGALSGPLLGLALAALVTTTADGRTGAGVIAGCCVAVLAVVQLTMSHFVSMVFGVLGERAVVATANRLTRAVQDRVTLTRQEDPDFADDLSLLQKDIFGVHFVVRALLETFAVVTQMLVTIALLGRLQPLLMLLPLAALAPYYAGRYGQRIAERTRTAVEADQRRAHALLTLAQKPGPMMEIRLAGLSGELERRQEELILRYGRTQQRSETLAALARTAGQLVFGLAYGIALFVVVRSAVEGRAGAGDVVLAIVLARQVATGVTQILSLALDMQRAGLIGARMRRIMDAAAVDEAAEATPKPGTGTGTGTDVSGASQAPGLLAEGIRLERVRFRYPGGDRDILRDVDMTLPAGSVVALVGENGAGKSTLVKLLCGLYEPTGGRILVDGLDLGAVAPKRWREATSAAFQDFVRLEFPVRQVVGVGDLPHVDDTAAVRAALSDAGALDLVEGFPNGLATPIGTSFADGRDLSGGQWQKLALARAMMRSEPVLLILDEPTAALDAQAEHALFERHLARAREAAAARGAIALFVSHRFSTVSMADHIIVLDDGAVIERGSHADLLAAGGTYARLFELQARGYRTEAAAG